MPPWAAHHQVFGAASWPTPLGNAWNGSASPVTSTARGQALWSTRLAERTANCVVVGASGRAYVAAARHLTAVDADGRIAWSVETEVTGGPVALTDGRLIVSEHYALTIRDQDTGERWVTLPVNALAAPTLTPAGHLVYCASQRGRPPVLQMATLAGEVIWSRPLVQRATSPPLAFDAVVIVGDGSYCRAYSDAGTLLWIANQDGFVAADAAPSAQLATRSNRLDDRVVTPVVGLDASRVLAGLTWYSGYGYFSFHVRSHTVHPVGAHLPLNGPLAVVYPPGGDPALVTAGWPVQNTRGNWEWEIVLVDLDGRLVWRHQTSAQPHTIIGDASGKVFLACSPSLERWENYRHWPAYNLAQECLVRCIDPGGQEVFTWFAPGPISSPLAIGATGELYLVAEGHLWAIA
jgi:outer membrane protein assembly factor BamB